MEHSPETLNEAAKILGRLGGLSRSSRKQAASRANGAKRRDEAIADAKRVYQHAVLIAHQKQEKN